jgi:hypothetical protein
VTAISFVILNQKGTSCGDLLNKNNTWGIVVHGPFQYRFAVKGNLDKIVYAYRKKPINIHARIFCI